MGPLRRESFSLSGPPRVSHLEDPSGALILKIITTTFIRLCVQWSTAADRLKLRQIDSVHILKSFFSRHLQPPWASSTPILPSTGSRADVPSPTNFVDTHNESCYFLCKSLCSFSIEPGSKVSRSQLMSLEICSSYCSP